MMGRACPTCGRTWLPALDEWRRADLVTLLQRAQRLPAGPERAQRIAGICQDFGVSRRTAQRYMKRAAA